MQSVAFAANTAEVYGDEISATTGKTVLIPVKIKNNTGIMGFKITVEYDKAVLTSPTVSRGKLTGNGMINDSIGVTEDGTFDVVWSDTQNVVGDGILMILSFKVLEAKDIQIKLSYSQPDTFNESWEDIELKCSDITINCTADEEVTESDTPIDATNLTVTLPSSEEIKDAVDIVLGETEKGHIDEISEEEKESFVDRTNEILYQLTGGTKKPFESVDEIKDAYNDAVADGFVDNAKDAVDSDKIESAIKDSLKSIGAESIDIILEEKKEEFVQKVENNLAQYAPDVDPISDKLSADEAVEAIKQLQNENSEEATQGEKVPVTNDDGKDYPIFLIIALAIVVAAITTIIVVYIYKKKKLKEAKTNEESI
ncbi:MAG: hypothetical protein IJD78_04140 [Clostridia bacterium]|nr:hypothetical protein [Clostridia bacterium]